MKDIFFIVQRYDFSVREILEIHSSLHNNRILFIIKIGYNAQQKWQINVIPSLSKAHGCVSYLIVQMFQFPRIQLRMGQKKRLQPTQRQNECACSADLWFERESITNPPLQSANSHLLPQYFFCWIRYVMEEARRNLSWKRQPYLFWFGLIHAKRKQTMGIIQMPPFCRVRLPTGDEHAHSFCRCVATAPLSTGSKIMNWFSKSSWEFTMLKGYGFFTKNPPNT